MKYCSKCGAEMADEAIFCVKCGCTAEGELFRERAKANSAVSTVAKVFMILTLAFWGLYALIFLVAFSAVGMAFFGVIFFIPLAWCLPMTIVYFNKTKHDEPIGVAFKICTLLFVNMVAGILMLCDNDN